MMFLEKISETTINETNNVINNAYKAFLSYRNFSGKLKANFLELIASGIEAERILLLQTAMQETFLADARLNGEITRTINQIKSFADLLKEGSWVKAIIDTAQPQRIPLPKPGLRQIQKPIGVVAVFGASNFPFAFSTAGGDTICALAAGCSVVYKAHPGHPQLSEMVAKIILDAAQKTKMPDGIFSMIQTASIETATYLVQHPLIKAVGFTGSLKAGRYIYDAAAKREEPIPVYAEMGSTNPVFILPEMMQQKGKDIAKMLAASNVLSTGQFCTNPGIIITHNSTAIQAFENIFADCIAENAGDAMLTGAIFSAYQNNTKKLSERNDVQLIRKGIKAEKQNAVAPYMFTASVNSFVENMELHEEVFGPSSLHIAANNKDEFMKIAESLQGQLTITIWATKKDLNDHRDLINYLELKAGRIIMNGVPTGVEVTHAMMHGGPYPATTDSKFTSVGSTAIYRFTRPVCYQNFDDKFLPEELQDANPLNILRMINGEFSKSKIEQ